ncbi:adenosylcobyric acid synthase (glutamine-hydrolysing) [Sinobaca qinghaiensis]|uniref:Cobyric acid synthase n=1 Tax=Sinobaca qinghaiensis TaxID=342944 RepID=A0A419V3A6_9BACL|nr:cobyric acid synthase [Sinobaca qinghaiensis]RKD72891.1 adenosylcobyric acid synthase (glutamine-hydrolysing) [Sinobaca qinghaiensis]
MKGLIVWGTTSDAGKSYIVTALCRALANRGYSVAPFKGQNMSNNSYITKESREIGRSQGLQAEACRTEATVDMNPVLLKPRSDRKAEVIIQGISSGSPEAGDYRGKYMSLAKEAIQLSLKRLEKEYDFIIMEGAGSPVEINLMDTDLANLYTAETAGVPALLVADIERGGVFAQLYGTEKLLPSDHRERLAGIIVNRFRGDPALFTDGVKWIEENVSPVLGVLPKLDIAMEREDSLSLNRLTENNTSASVIDLAFIALPYISNYTDVEPFTAEPDVSIRFIHAAEDFGDPDAVIIPGTRSTILDLHHLERSGTAALLKSYINSGGTVAGICGGLQMLGEELIDEEGNDSGTAGTRAAGLGILPLVTSFEAEKTTRRWSGRQEENEPIHGYEIHTGRSSITYSAEVVPLFYSNSGGEPEGIVSHNGRITGTYLHHVFHNDEWRSRWLNQVRKHKNLPGLDVVYYEKEKDQRLDELAAAFERHVNVDDLIDLMESTADDK